MARKITYIAVVLTALLATVSLAAKEIAAKEIAVQKPAVQEKAAQKPAPQEKAPQEVVVSGYVRDKASGEPLPGAAVFTSDKAQGTSSDSFGFYALYLEPGEYDIVCSLVGYIDETLHADATNGSVQLNYHLKEDIQLLEEAVISTDIKKEILTLPQMGLQTVDMEMARKLPALMGENDILRVIQMVPGVQSANEGSTGFSVRGGGADQNLILMDGAPVYSSGHFLGFMSVFNGDAIRKVQLYKGDFPARYGSMTSSVLDISTADGDPRKFAGSASIGLLTSKLHFSGPIIPGKLTFSVSAKRSYMDMFFPLISKIPEGSKLAFYDANAKISWTPDENNRVQLSLFGSDDRFGLGMDNLSIKNMLFDYTNNTQSLRWNHIFSPALSSELTLYNSFYKGSMEIDMDETPCNWHKNLNETGIRHNLAWHIDRSNTLDFGWEAAYIYLNPSECHPTGESAIVDVVTPAAYAISPALYAENESKLGALSLRYGLRYSSFARIGKKEDRIWYHGLDPRLSTSYSLDERTTLKASYTRTHQYLEQASIGSTNGVLDTWFAASKTVKPQISDQFSVGASRGYLKDALRLSLEAFYKNNKNTVDLKDNAGMVILDQDPESLLRFGTSYSVGAELMAEYEFSKVNGWISYTWMKSMYDIEGVNNDIPYRSPLNHDHAVNIVTCWDISRRVSASATWVYYSGTPTTLPTGRFSYGGTYVPIYSSRNADKLPDYHRADLSLTLKGKKKVEEKRWGGEWNFSIYNLYGRHNAWTISYGYNEKEEKMEAELIYLFSVMPSVSYTIEF